MAEGAAPGGGGRSDAEAGPDPLTTLLAELGPALAAQMQRAGLAALAAPPGEQPQDALWRIASAQGTAWSAALRAASARAARSAPGAAALARFLDPAQWLLGGDGAPEPALDRLVAPATDPELARGPEAAALRAALARHRALVGAAYLDMMAAVARRLAETDRPDFGQAQALWIEAAGRTLDRLHASEGFLASQARVAAAAVALRRAERAAEDARRRERGEPTRADVDALAETVATLRRELRALRRDMARGDGAGPESGRAPDAPGRG
ncbi:poly(R)-hydroxyalkanoic acid synthase subunit PhaE [Rubrimonas cliftonensis]|uniref:Poly(3-hydroxyalkanoate) polymerase subunit PhaE n=1 Tax=Rubrimonas cliftonensis TaxID=89524 RepID=A0A1H3W602_9RHOB|nr:poly(R)-hydroxyalkanoic acid synthase subunit PhaE [Rubrimonas cliftonensis]SDZ82420.1 Poly(R)-hydroxyalkanoic acid synthase subunit (PHA_synth_III_E) [Rubrimonas cliftonensis]